MATRTTQDRRGTGRGARAPASVAGGEAPRSEVAVELLGRPQLRVAGRWQRLDPDRRGQLLAYLAYAGERTERARLADLLWGEQSLDGAFRNLRHVLHGIRRWEPALGLDADRDSMTWCVPCDARELKAALDVGDAARAIALYRGPLLPGFAERAGGAYAHWLEVEREHLRLGWRDAALAWARAAARGDGAAMVPAALRSLVEQDLDEEALVIAIEALEHLGEHARARMLAERFRRQVVDAFGVEPGPAVRALTEPAPGRQAQPAGDLATPWGGGPFVGRDGEVADVLTWLRAGDRLVAITGAGGTGKSRLAHVVAARFAPSDSTVVIVAVDRAGTDREVVAAVAAAAGAVVDASEAIDAALQRVVPADVSVVIVDDVEHEGAVAPVVEALLRVRPAASVLVTGPSPLRLPGERVLPLEGLGHGGEAALLPAAARALPAVALFTALAERHAPGFEVDDHDLAAVRAIAAAVDGSPLGLELAAPWVRSLSVAELASQVGGDPDFLTSPTRTSTRHRSLRAAFEHAADLLSPSQRGALTRLSLFGAPFSREAAAVVADVPLALLASLVDRSLVRVGPDHRFSLPAPVRAFAREALEADTEGARSVRSRLVSYALGLIRHGFPVAGFPNAAAFARARVEQAHLLAACDAAAAIGRDDELARLTSAVALVSELRGRVDEAETLVARALASPVPSGRRARQRRARLLAQHAWLVHWHAPGEAAAMAAAALAALAPSDGLGQAWARRAAAMAAWRSGAYEEAEAHAHGALVVVERHGPAAWRAVLLDGLGLCLAARGAGPAAERAFAEALALNERFDDPFQATQNLINLASQARRRGAARTAVAYARRAVDLACAIGYDQYVPHALTQLAACALAAGDVSTAASVAEEAVTTAQRAGDGYVRIWSLLVSGEAGLLADRPGAAADLANGIGAALAVHDRKQLLQGLAGVVRAARGRDDGQVSALALATARAVTASAPLLRQALAPLRPERVRHGRSAASRAAARRVRSLGVEGAVHEITALVRAWVGATGIEPRA